MLSITGREYDILNTLWSSDEPMTLNDILRENLELTSSTVTLAIRKMLKAGLVEVVGSVRSGKVFARTYRPTELSKNTILQKFFEDYKQFNNIIPESDLCSAILRINNSEKSKEEIRKLKAILDEIDTEE